ncbi:MAG: hypothetical protein P4M12_10810 [Gammaproteobacteria bacterium]|nr:hypothetical protein [Gammaproteobacteria bacterium]
MFSKSSGSLSKPPEDVIYHVLIKYKYDSSQVDEFRKWSALYGALSDPEMQQFLEESSSEEENSEHDLYEAELKKAKLFLSQKGLTDEEKKEVNEAFEKIAIEMNEKKNNAQPKSR